ncbi:ribosome-binding factor A [Candidatus Peregrinibacteria bacterium]|nr:ribosome-binding factor A [Candidatus Peregrinibacteria bacterium]
MKRTDRLKSSVRRLIAPVLRECPRECGIVSITEIEVSPDLSYATVLVSALHKSGIAMEFLGKRRSALQRRMGKLQTHKTPLLRFRADLSSEQESRIDELLR